MNEPNGRGGSFIGFLAFCVTMFAAILYLVAMSLSFFEIDVKIVDTLQSIASALMICIVSVIGWRFVKTRNTVWKTIYVMVLLIVVASVIIPVVLQFVAAK